MESEWRLRDRLFGAPAAEEVAVEVGADDDIFF